MSEANTDSKHIDELTSETNVETVIKAMLTESTGRHMMDSGDAYGRHWEENQKTPPWNKPRLQVEYDYVVMNIYHFLAESDLGLERDQWALQRERELYDYAEDRSGSWLTDMEDFAEVKTYGGGHGIYGDVVRENTYNTEYGALTQDFQFVFWPEGEDHFVALQIHQGADIRGGYTKPRVFRFGDVYEPTRIIPSEFQFYCHDCGWGEAESVLAYDDLQEITRPELNECHCPECGETLSVH